MSCRYHSDVPKWTNELWLVHLHRGSSNIFHYCLNSDGFNLHMRVVQGHSGGNKVDLSQLDNVIFRTIEVSTCITLVLLLICILLSNQD